LAYSDDQKQKNNWKAQAHSTTVEMTRHSHKLQCISGWKVASTCLYSAELLAWADSMHNVMLALSVPF